MTQPDSDRTAEAPTGESAAAGGTAPVDAAPVDAAPVDATVSVDAAVDRRTVRRAPRYGRFVVVGIVLGALLAFLLSGTPPSQEAVRTNQVLARSDLFWLLFLTLGFFGGILGAVVALVADRVSLRSRARRMRGVLPGSVGDADPQER